MYIKGMFHWICPECGREIPPAVKECPVCDPQIYVASPADSSPSAANEPSGEALSEVSSASAPVSAPAVAPAPVAQVFAKGEARRIPGPVLQLAHRIREEHAAERRAELAQGPAEPAAIASGAESAGFRGTGEKADRRTVEELAEPAIASAPETTVAEAEPEVADPVSQVALAVHEENVEEQELAEPAIASAPETTVAEAEPEIADPVSQVALAVHEENVEEQELAEPAIASAPETTVAEAEPEDCRSGIAGGSRGSMRRT